MTKSHAVYLPEQSLIDPDYKAKPMLSKEEFFDGLYREVGKLFGMSDVRCAE